MHPDRLRGPLAGAAGAAVSLALLACGLREPYRPRFESGGAGAATARRIVSLSLSTDEIVLGLGGPGRVIGTTWLSHDPESAHLASVAQSVGPPIRRVSDVEALLELRPDLLVADEYNTPDSLLLLGRAGVPVFRVRMPRSVADVERNVADLGRALGAEERAGAMIEEIRRARAEAETRTQGRQRPRVLGISYGTWANAAGTLVDDLIRIAGGKNVIHEAMPFGGFDVSVEEILELEPEVIVCGGAAPTGPLAGRIRARIVVLPMRDAHPPSQFVAAAIRVWNRALCPE